MHSVSERSTYGVNGRLLANTNVPVSGQKIRDCYTRLGEGRHRPRVHVPSKCVAFVGGW
jgi:hypothetical protein